ncbi:MAG: DNA polymerase III subunit delta' [Elainellaceae cyanobacterium]
MALFSDVIGQPQATGLLTQVLSRCRIAPAYLFVGPSGIGKRLTAQRFAAALLTQAPVKGAALQSPDQRFYPDLLWVEPTYLHQGQRLTPAEAELAGVKRRSPPQIRLELVREMTRFLARPPLNAPRSVVVIDGAEAMAEPAANALLKTLEEPGNATLLVIAHSSELLPTIISRCQKVPFQRLSGEDMAAVLQRQGAIELLARPDLLSMAQGSPGRAIAALNQWNQLSIETKEALDHLPTDVRQALTMAQSLAGELDVEAQLWAIDYLQHHDYGKGDPSHSWAVCRRRLQTLEQARQQLQRYVQPRLVWEVALMSLAGALP